MEQLLIHKMEKDVRMKDKGALRAWAFSDEAKLERLPRLRLMVSHPLVEAAVHHLCTWREHKEDKDNLGHSDADLRFNVHPTY